MYIKVYISIIPKQASKDAISLFIFEHCRREIFIPPIHARFDLENPGFLAHITWKNKDHFCADGGKLPPTFLPRFPSQLYLKLE